MQILLDRSDAANDVLRKLLIDLMVNTEELLLEDCKLAEEQEKIQLKRNIIISSVASNERIASEVENIIGWEKEPRCETAEHLLDSSKPLRGSDEEM